MEANRHASSEALGARRDGQPHLHHSAVLYPQRLRHEHREGVGLLSLQKRALAVAREAVGGGDVVDDVRARATARAIGLRGAFELPDVEHVAPTTARQQVAPAAADQRVESSAAEEAISGPPARHLLDPAQPVTIRAAPAAQVDRHGAPAVRVVDPVAPLAAVDVVARALVVLHEPVAPGAAVQRVSSPPAVDHVRARGPSQHVVAALPAQLGGHAALQARLVRAIPELPR